MAKFSADMLNLLTNVAQILDVVKAEWGDAWSSWDQEQRDAITKALIEGFPADGEKKRE